MENTFKNKVALVTGGSSGIGRATALAFARKGAKIVVADWVENLETMDMIENLGGEAIFVKCDVSNSADVKVLIEKTKATFGQLDFAFNNAGIEGTSAPTQDCTEENWDKTIGINLKGIWLCMKYERKRRNCQLLFRCWTRWISRVASLCGVKTRRYWIDKNCRIGKCSTRN